MMMAGMDVARFNFSHGTHPEHSVLIKAVRAAAKKAGKDVGLLQDLQGPKIRIGDLPKGGVELHEGQTITFSGAKNALYSPHCIPLSYARLGKDVKKGHRILLDDGYLEVEVLKTKGNTATAVVKVGGNLKSHKGANFPDSVLLEPAFTDKDREDLLFGIKEGVDFICLSFVSNPKILGVVRALIAKESRRARIKQPKLLAKVETKAALLCVDEIIDASDGIMLGRGDLGVEIPGEEVPVVQKDIAERCRLSGKPIIVATQMLESMRENPRATRAEISDVANAVFDHADAVMLSAESATGRYPFVTVQAMASVIREAEASRFDELHPDANVVNCIPSSLAHTLALMAERGLIRAIVLASSVQASAGSLVMFRPKVPFIAVVPDAASARQISLHAGVTPMIMDDRGGSFVPRLHGLLHARLKLPRGQAVAYVSAGISGGVSLSLLPL
jgi:pyruvate kinase